VLPKDGPNRYQPPSLFLFTSPGAPHAFEYLETRADPRPEPPAADTLSAAASQRRVSPPASGTA
jgi:hypothetical protein